MSGGRPAWIPDEQVIKKVEKLSAQGLTQEQIGSVLGISHETMCKKKREYPEFAEAIKRGRDKGIATITNALFEKARSGDNTAIIFYLKNRDRANWKDRQTISGDEEAPLKIEAIERVIVDPKITE